MKGRVPTTLCYVETATRQTYPRAWKSTACLPPIPCLLELQMTSCPNDLRIYRERVANWNCCCTSNREMGGGKPFYSDIVPKHEAKAEGSDIRLLSNKISTPNPPLAHP